MHVRLTSDLSEAGIMKSLMEMSPDGAEWKVLFDAVYRKTA